MQVGEVTGGYIRAKVRSAFTGTLTNTVTVDWNTYGSTVTETVSATDAVQVNTSANLVLHKEVSTLVTAGEEVGFTLMVTNLGPSDAAGVIISDSMASPPYEAGTVSYTVDNGANWEEWSGSITTPGTLANGATLYLKLRGVLTGDFSGTLTNTGTVTSSTFDPVPGNNTYSVYPEAGTSADISILKTGPATAVAGETITYTLVISNDGPSVAIDVVIEDIFSSSIYSGVQYSFGTSTGTWTGSLDISNLSKSETATVTITALVKPDQLQGRTITNTALANSSTPDPDHDNNSSTATSTVTSVTDVSIAKTVVTPAENIVAGETIRYNLAVTNNGPSNAYTVVAMDIPSPGITLVQYSGNGGASWNHWPSPGNQITLGTMVPGQTANILVEGILAVNSCGTLTNTATVSTTTTETVYENNVSAPVAVTVLDRTLPQITCPENKNISCDTFPDPLQTGSPLSVTDNCDNNPGITYTDTTTPGACTNNYIITRTWKATDAGGNFASCTQTITVYDNTPPEISCPPGYSVKCARDVPAAASSLSEFTSIGGTVSDNCTVSSTITILRISDVISNQTCHNRYTLTRTYQATDACSNSATCQHIITVYDDVAADFDVPDDMIIQCDDDITDLALTGTVSGTIVGNCGGINQEATYTDAWDESGELCNGTGRVIRTWKVTDQCGNSSTDTQSITISDLIAPQVTCAGDQVRNTDPGVCTYTVSGTEFDIASLSDNCGLKSITNDINNGTTLAGESFESGTTTITWTVVDNCYNTATCSMTVTIVDTELPAVTHCPDFRDIIGCELSAITGPAFSTITATSTYGEFSSLINNGAASDNCGTLSITYRDEVSGTSVPYDVTRIWIIADRNGNISRCTQTVKVNNLPPIAVDDEFTIIQNTSLTSIVLGNDYDMESQEFTVISWGDPSPSGLNFNTGENGVFTFTPSDGFTGDVTFTYTIEEGCSSGSATVTIHVLPCLTDPPAPGNVVRTY